MSSINPNNIDGTYPIAGQDNDSQGFRNNFTNIRNNLTFASLEITELQQKAILKSAIAGETINNDMTNTPLVGARISRFTETLKNFGPVNGSIPVNWTDGHFQLLEITGNTTVTLGGWPTSGFYSSMVLDVTPTVDNAYLTLAGFTNPSALVNATNIQSFSGNTIPLTTGNVSYRFEFSTYDGGTTISVRDLYRNYDSAIDFSQLNVTGNVLAAGAVVNSLIVNGEESVTGNLNVTGNVLAAGAVVNSLTVNGEESVTGNLNVTGNVLAAIVNTGILNATGTITVVDVTSTGNLNITGNVLAAGAVVNSLIVNGEATITGNLVRAGGTIDTGYQYSNVSANVGLTIGTNVGRLILDPTQLESTYVTVTLPGGNVDAKVVTISSTQTIQFLNVQTDNGTTLVNNGNITLSAGTAATYFYHASETKWYKIG
jgi:hypothetical protein